MKPEIILDIVEVSRDGYDGYVVTTNKQEIDVLISNGQNCCENWGYLSTPDDTKPFIGATLIDVAIVDTDLNVLRKPEQGYWRDDESAIFVNFVTDRGLFQLTVYNAHNGYYGHNVTIKSKQVSLDSGL